MGCLPTGMVFHPPRTPRVRVGGSDRIGSGFRESWVLGCGTNFLGWGQ